MYLSLEHCFEAKLVGVPNFFLGACDQPAAGLTNQVRIRDSDPGVPLPLSPFPFLRFYFILFYFYFLATSTSIEPHL